VAAAQAGVHALQVRSPEVCFPTPQASEETSDRHSAASKEQRRTGHSLPQGVWPGACIAFLHRMPPCGRIHEGAFRVRNSLSQTASMRGRAHLLGPPLCERIASYAQGEAVRLAGLGARGTRPALGACMGAQAQTDTAARVGVPEHMRHLSIRST